MGLRYEGGTAACTLLPLPLALFPPLSALLLDPQTCMHHTLSHLGDFARMFFLHFIRHHWSRETLPDQLCPATHTLSWSPCPL